MCDTTHTTADIAAITGRSPRHIQRMARQMFGDVLGYRRTLTDEQAERIRMAIATQPGRWRKITLSHVDDNRNSQG